MLSLYAYSRFEVSITMLFNLLEINARHCIHGMVALMLPAVAIAVSLNPCVKPEFINSSVNVDSEALLARAEQCKGAKQYELAVPLFQQYMVLVPNNPRAYADEAFCLNGMHDFNGALQCADHSLEIGPDDVDALSNRAWALNHLGRFAEALESSKAALNLDPSDAESWCEQGEALMGMGDYKSALVAFNKHCGLHDEEWYAYDRRAACYDKLGETDLAKRDREKIQSL
jgi:tetratricopeptide (TPR) repeat protein